MTLESGVLPDQPSAMIGDGLPPVRFEEAVQSHGAVVVVNAASTLVTHASENTGDVLGSEPLALLGVPVGKILDSDTVATLTAVLDEGQDTGNPTFTKVGGQPFDVIVHRVDDSVIVEFEPYTETSREMVLATRMAMRRFAMTGSSAELLSLAANEFRRITGFDRVMVEVFDSHGHGEIVAESVTDDLNPRLGLRLPASGIPDQARTLAATKMSRLIVNAEDPPVALLADPQRASAESVDLSQAELRAVTAHHRAFMRNQDMVSCFTLSMVHNNALIGMIIGGHRTERRLPYNIRDGFEILAGQVSVQLTAMRDLEALEQRDRMRGLRSELVAPLSQSDDWADALLHHEITLLDLIPADGVALKLGDAVHSKGTVPVVSLLAKLPELFPPAGSPVQVVTESLASQHPDLAGLLPGVAGLLMQPLGHDGDYIAWFRGERSRFPGWVDDFEGTSEPWDGAEREARELARDLQENLLRRAESRLAEIALHDPLTGLPNRRLLMDRLQQELLSVQPDERLTVLFIDLDKFKEINDTYGHAAGDAALRHTAIALRSAARAEDTVARLGGDEFVVLCPGVDRKDARTLATRMLKAIAAHPAGDAPWTVSGSVGIALAERNDDASRVLSAADAALYRAKMTGPGTASE